jgi:hypothetical protein
MTRTSGFSRCATKLLILQRQVSTPAFNPTDRVLPAGLIHRLPGRKLR